MTNQIFDSNALVAFEFMQPVRIVFPNPVQTGLVITSIGLKWNTTKKRKINTEYQFLLDYLGENLPLNRKYQGGFFFAQVHCGQSAPWRVTDTNDKAAIIYTAMRKADDVCVKNLKITIGEYAGEDLRTAIIAAINRNKS
jgi:hypothetical protein